MKNDFLNELFCNLSNKEYSLDLIFNKFEDLFIANNISLANDILLTIYNNIDKYNMTILIGFLSISLVEYKHLPARKKLVDLVRNKANIEHMDIEKLLEGLDPEV